MGEPSESTKVDKTTVSSDEPNQNNANSSDDKPRPDQLALKFARKSAMAFMDSAGVPRLKPFKNPAGDLGWPVRSQQTEEWIAGQYFGKTGQLIDPGSIKRVILVLAGLAEQRGTISHDIGHLIEADPFLGFLIQFVRHNRTYAKPATELLVELHAMAIYAPENDFLNWPTSPEALGRRIRTYGNILKHVGIETHFRRDKHRRTISLSDIGDRGVRKPSPNPSPLGPENSQLNPTNDGGDGSTPNDLRMEFDQITKGLKC